MAFAETRLVAVRSHHEGFVTAPALLTALSLLVPFAGALWARVASTQIHVRQRVNVNPWGDI